MTLHPGSAPPRCGIYVIVPNPLAVSSWALHRTLGIAYPDSPEQGRGQATAHGDSNLDLLQLPAELKSRGIGQLQLCHFHLPLVEDGYLDELKSALKQYGVELHAILIDDGDLTDPTFHERDLRWIARWLAISEKLGARHARVIAGKHSSDEVTLERAIRGLKTLVQSTGVRVETENWYALMDTPEAVNHVLDQLDGRLGFCVDWGNWPKPRKYADLPLVMNRAETCHAKLEIDAFNQVEEEDARKCLEIAENASFSGAYVIVNGGSGKSEWEAILAQKRRLESGP